MRTPHSLKVSFSKNGCCIIVLTFQLTGARYKLKVGLPQEAHSQVRAYLLAIPLSSYVMTQKTLDLEQIRLGINNVDTQIIQLLAQRRELARQVAYYKLATGKPIKDVQREQQLITRLINQIAELQLDVPADLLNAVYRNIIDDSCNYQQKIILQERELLHLQQAKKLQISYLGYPGSTCYTAVKKFTAFLGKEAEMTGFGEIKRVIDCLVECQTEYAVVPLANTHSGSSNEIYDLLATTSLEVVADLELDINHVLLAKAFITPKEIQKIYTTASAYRQANRYLLEMLTNATIEFCETSYHAAQACTQDANPHTVALGNYSLAQIFSLEVISDNIANAPHRERLIVLGKHQVPLETTLSYKTMLMFITRQQQGALVTALESLKKYQINLTKIESRAMNTGVASEMFFLEVEGHVDSPTLQQALTELATQCRALKVLGSFPSFLITAEA